MLDLTARYPSQVISGDSGYPYGKARNRVSPGDGTGTPYEADLLNDILGSLQAIVSAGFIDVSGVPDEAGASDVLNALTALIARPAATYSITAGTATACDITAISADPGYSIAGGKGIQVLSPGRYLVSWGAAMTSTDALAARRLSLELRINTTVKAEASGKRWSSTAADIVTVQNTFVIDISSPGSELIYVYPRASNGTPAVNATDGGKENTISIVKIS